MRPRNASTSCRATHGGRTGLVASVALLFLASGATGREALGASAPSASSPAASGPVASARTVSIEGRVTDAAGRGLAGAQVEWGYIYDPPEKISRTVTDADGHYRLEVDGWGVDYRLIAAAPGHAPKWIIPRAGWMSAGHDLPRDSEVLPPKTADFQLEPEHALRGIVVDEQSRPIANVQVTARTAVEGFWSSFSSPSPAMSIPGKGASATTGPDGRFRLSGLPAEQVQLNLKAPHRHVNDANYPVDEECRIVMRGSGRAGKIRVRVVDAGSEKPVPSFAVVRRYDPEPRVFNSPEGVFELTEDVSEGGRYLLYIYSKAHAPATLDIKAMALDCPEEDMLELEAGRPLLGRLVDAGDGRALGGVQVLCGIVDEEKTSYFEWADLQSYADGHHPLTGVQKAVTDADGRFWFSEAKDNPSGTLFILAKGYERMILRPEERPAVPEGTNETVINMHPEASISGVLRRGDGTAARIAVSVWKADPRTQPEETFERCSTDENGRFQLGSLAPGTYQVSYWLSPSRTASSPRKFATVTLRRGETKELGETKVGEK